MHTNHNETFQLKILLEDSQPPIWRRVLVPADLTLLDLHLVIQIAMGWLDTHMHAFEHGRRLYGPPASADGWSMIETENESTVRISDLLHREADQLHYAYDFGDGWRHRITLEKCLIADPTTPRCTEAVRACPPEDRGGVDGYKGLLAVVAGAGSPDRDGQVEPLTARLDPERVDLAAINLELDEVFEARHQSSQVA